ncbi:MAG: TMEM165/GDT1 family protein [Candidatus Krumholzibacteriota bacterium]|nr:TMEM165/GDT1 family protein [Candidatus Krumholzibacteriota bacterium]
MWRVFFTTFAVMFLAELGDKTQLTVIACSSRFNNPRVVFAGAAAAMIAATAIGVAVGTFLPSLLGERVIRWISGGLFVFFGLLILAGK